MVCPASPKGVTQRAQRPVCLRQKDVESAGSGASQQSA